MKELIVSLQSSGQVGREQQRLWELGTTQEEKAAGEGALGQRPHCGVYCLNTAPQRPGVDVQVFMGFRDDAGKSRAPRVPLAAPGRRGGTRGRATQRGNGRCLAACS